MSLRLKYSLVATIQIFGIHYKNRGDRLDTTFDRSVIYWLINVEYSNYGRVLHRFLPRPSGASWQMSRFFRAQLPVVNAPVASDVMSVL